ncbi:hypothetical protein [Bradyrhizobium sp. CCBAU 11434]|uniref:hypothetical protein n=1 Tax=Bradyrhizobium sp. CCBAU 11434 TaxID=1630885 RepID=UPI00230535D8|nr:hypothetical protein [Bradyrhizobium sp. CCBAU 11434]
MLPAIRGKRVRVSYYLPQSPGGAAVLFLQKVYSEAVINHRLNVWDVHVSDGRWWIITNPTNLHSQEQFRLRMGRHSGSVAECDDYDAALFYRHRNGR